MRAWINECMIIFIWQVRLRSRFIEISSLKQRHVWATGIRVYGGRVFHLAQHITRMMNSAKAMAFENVPTPAFIRVWISHNQIY
jgi:hypothetical protein